jgi:CRP-like cAMP-binding protein
LSVAHEARSQKSGDGRPPTDIPVELPLSRTEIADYLGLTLETVSRQVARLRERGVVTAGAGRSMVLHHPEVLEATVESAQPSARVKEAMRL